MLIQQHKIIWDDLLDHKYKLCIIVTHLMDRLVEIDLTTRIY